MQAGGDRKTVDGYRKVAMQVARDEAFARKHQVAGAFKYLEDFGVNLVDIPAEVQVPVFPVVEVEERFNRDIDLQQRLDAEVNGDADGECASTHVEVDHGEERAFRRALQLGQDGEQVGLHHQQQARSWQFQQDHALHVEDDA